MRLIASTTNVPADVVNSLVMKPKVAWFGINGFEDRCVASLERLNAAKTKLSAIHFIDYPTIATPTAEDYIIRKAHRELVVTIAKNHAARFYSAKVDAYASTGLEAEFQSFIKSAANNSVLIIDFTCFTKIHIITLVNMLSNIDLHHKEVLVVYTSPWAYGNLDRIAKQIGWRDVIIAPVASNANMKNEAYSRGLVIAGHESERLWAALNEIEPASGVLTLGRIPARPDITRLSEQVNKKIIKHMALDYDAAWRVEVIDVSDVDGMEKCVASEVEKARESDAPVILYPFGPKSLIFVASRYLFEHYAESSWFVYPVPARYDLSYSEGSAAACWFKIDAEEAILG